MKDIDIVVKTEPDSVNGMYFWFLLKDNSNNRGHGWATSMQEAFNNAIELINKIKEDE